MLPLACLPLACLPLAATALLLALPTLATPQQRPLALAAPRVHATAIALLPDGTPLLGRSDGLIVTVDPLAGATERTFAQHSSSINHIAIDPRGELVAAAAADGRVALWPIRRDRDVTDSGFPGRRSEPTATLNAALEIQSDALQVEWTHDGSHLVTWSSTLRVGESSSRVRIWTREGEILWTGPNARRVTVHPTRNQIAAVAGEELLLGWPEAGLRSFELGPKLCAVEFSPDGTRLAVSGKDFNIWVLGSERGEVQTHRRVTDVDPLELHDAILGLHWSPDGKWLGVGAATGLNPAIVDVRDLTTVWAPGLLGGRIGTVFDVAWTPDGRLLTGFGATIAIDPMTRTETVLATGVEAHDVLALPAKDRMLLLASGTVREIALATGATTWTRAERAHGDAVVHGRPGGMPAHRPTLDDQPMYGALRHVQLLGVTEAEDPTLRFASSFQNRLRGEVAGRIGIFERAARSTRGLSAPTAVLRLPYGVLPVDTSAGRVPWRVLEIGDRTFAVIFDAAAGRAAVLDFATGATVAELGPSLALEDARVHDGQLEVLLRTASEIDHIIVDIDTPDVTRVSVVATHGPRTVACFVASDAGHGTLDEVAIALVEGGHPVLVHIDLRARNTSRMAFDTAIAADADLRVAAWGHGALRRFAVGLTGSWSEPGHVLIAGADDGEALHPMHVVSASGPLGDVRIRTNTRGYGQAVAFLRDVDGDQIADLAIGCSAGGTEEHLDIVSTRTGRSWSRHASPQGILYRTGCSVSVGPVGRYVLAGGGHVAVPEDLDLPGEAILVDTTRRGVRMSAFVSPGRAR